MGVSTCLCECVGDILGVAFLLTRFVCFVSGRALVTIHDGFAILNVYVPNDGQGSKRLPFKVGVRACARACMRACVALFLSLTNTHTHTRTHAHARTLANANQLPCVLADAVPASSSRLYDCVATRGPQSISDGRP